jgi:biotin carboxyl carrier protein
MRYMASLGEQRFLVGVEDGQPRQVSLDGVEQAVNWLRIGAGEAANSSGRYSLLLGNRSYEVVVRRLEPDDEGGQRYEVLLGGQPYEVRLEDERARALASLAGGAHESGESTIKAPMPGLVVNLPVVAGDLVQRGQTVAVLEVMKMENDLTAPRSGVVKEVKVARGQAVNQGQALLVIGEPGAGASPPEEPNGNGAIVDA